MYALDELLEDPTESKNQLGLSLCNGPNRYGTPPGWSAERWTIGRRQQNDLCIRDTHLAGLHVFIDRADQHFVLCASGHNGVVLNRKYFFSRHEEAVMYPSTWIQAVGHTTLFHQQNSPSLPFSPIQDEEDPIVRLHLQEWKLQWAKTLLMQEFERQQTTAFEHWDHHNSPPWREVFPYTLTHAPAPKLMNRAMWLFRRQEHLDSPAAPQWAKWLRTLEDIEKTLETSSPSWPAFKNSPRWFGYPWILGTYKSPPKASLTYTISTLLFEVFLAACSPRTDLWTMSSILFGACTYKALVQLRRRPNWKHVSAPEPLFTAPQVDPNWKPQYEIERTYLPVPTTPLFFFAYLKDPTSVEAGFNTYHQILQEWNNIQGTEPNPEELEATRDEWEESLFDEP